jgi:hypothetical protein
VSAAPTAVARVGIAAAAAALAVVTSQLLWVAAGPIFTDDLWFHMGAGRAYTRDGPWPERDPLLHTAHADAPVQHEWLFGVAVHGAERLLGLQGLRIVHALVVLAILALVFATLRRECGSSAWAAALTAVFLALAWKRLFQFRPDLVSIPATVLTYRWLLQDGRPPSWRRVLAFVVLLALWANFHSLFAIGPALLVAALLGLGLRALLRRLLTIEGSPPPPEGPTARRLGAALLLGTLAAGLNPRGFRHHLTFLTSSRDSAIWSVRDEWTPFAPFDLESFGHASGPLSFFLDDAIGALFLVAVVLLAARLLAAPSRDRLAAADPVPGGVGLAGCVALLVSIRFEWMMLLPLLALVRFARSAGRALPHAAVAAGLALAIAVAFPLRSGIRKVHTWVPRDVERYRSWQWTDAKYYAEGMAFLRECGIEGHLFNQYWLGGFLGYWLAPGLRTFVDGRVEHYPPQVLDDARTITGRMLRSPRGTFLDLLDAYEVDVFFGVGTAPSGQGVGLGVFSAGHLEGTPGWIPAFRSSRVGIYLRAGPEGAANRARASRCYAAHGIPFDSERGFDPASAIGANPGWATRFHLIPEAYAKWRTAAASRDPEALTRLGEVYAAVGAYAEGERIERELLAIRPGDRDATRRLVWDLLRQGRTEEATGVANAARTRAPTDPHLRLAGQVAYTAHTVRQRGNAMAARTVQLRYPLFPGTREGPFQARFRPVAAPLEVRGSRTP